jgi:hypothetical protein
MICNRHLVKLTEVSLFAVVVRMSRPYCNRCAIPISTLFHQWNAGAGASASDAGGARQTLCPRERSAAISATLHTDDQIASLRRQ